jgi:hypothetical protein
VTEEINKDVQDLLHQDASKSNEPAVGAKTDETEKNPATTSSEGKDQTKTPEEMARMGLIAPLPTITKAVSDVYGNDVETVTMIFPSDVTIVNKDHHRIKFSAGVQEVPVVDQDNWYLKANGVKVYEK